MGPVGRSSSSRHLSRSDTLKRITDKPWEKPGFKFSIGWPSGFENGSPFEASPTKADVGSKAGKIGGASRAEDMRNGGLASILTGRGYLGVLSPRTSAEVAKTDRIRRTLA
jgi:hypothetical protein